MRLRMSEDIGLKLGSAAPQTNSRASHYCIPVGAWHKGFEANMAPDDLFELPLPFALKNKIVSERPIVLTLGGHERDSKVNITVWS
jgi:hypothetical protein